MCVRIIYMIVLTVIAGSSFADICVFVGTVITITDAVTHESRVQQAVSFIGIDQTSVAFAWISKTCLLPIMVSH